MRMSTWATALTVAGFVVVGAVSCSSDSGGGSGGKAGSSSGGSAGSSAGSGGSSGGSAGGSAGAGGSTGGAGGGLSMNPTPAFKSFKPCTSEASYTAGLGVDTISQSGLSYTPKCVRVKKGSKVTFKGKTTDDNFTTHPLLPYADRSEPAADNPIKETKTGDSVTFTFDKVGFFGFYCMNHGGSGEGANMAGMIWVTED